MICSRLKNCYNCRGGGKKLFSSNTRTILQQNISWFVIAAIFFVTGIAAAILFMGNERIFLGDLTAGQKKMLEDLAELVFGGSPLRGITLLLINNLLASLQMMLLGAILGIPPLLGLFVNGALLGSVVVLAAEKFQLLHFILLGILPHGIFELPAFIISAAFGLKVGFHLVFPLHGKKRGESLVTIWREYWSVFPLVLNLLIVAAIFEVMITPFFLKNFYDFLHRFCCPPGLISTTTAYFNAIKELVGKLQLGH